MPKTPIGVNMTTKLLTRNRIFVIWLKLFNKDLIKVINRLFHSHVTTEHEQARIPDLVLPLAYPFPDMGKLLSLVFIVFAAWFYDNPLTFLDYPVMLTIGLFLSFGMDSDSH
jgi:hypothetical protein